MKDENKSITVIVLLVLGLVVVSGLYAMNAASPVTTETEDKATGTSNSKQNRFSIET